MAATCTTSQRGKVSPKALGGGFVAVAVIWLFLDRITKAQFSALTPDGVLAGPYLGLIDIRLVHNTGAAWGIFSHSTFALGIFSLIVCIVLALVYFANIKHCSIISTIGFGLVISGGIGNAIDRFLYGYVTDFIEFSFIDFPVFNIADIGVTCGFVLIIVGYLLQGVSRRFVERNERVA